MSAWACRKGGIEWFAQTQIRQQRWAFLGDALWKFFDRNLKGSFAPEDIDNPRAAFAVTSTILKSKSAKGPSGTFTISPGCTAVAVRPFFALKG